MALDDHATRRAQLLRLWRSAAVSGAARASKAPKPEGAARFNRWCELLGLAGLLAIAPFARAHEPNANLDFPQYYMGGLVALHGDWEALYPVPDPRSLVNAGFSGASTPHPRYAQLAASAGVRNGDRFILPPPMALILVPVAALPFRTAEFAWTIAMILFAWAAVRESSRLVALIRGVDTRVAGIFVLFACASPLLWRTVLLGQLSAVGAWCVAVTTTGLLKASNSRTSLGVLGSSLTKQIGVFHLLLVAVLGRWRALAGIAIGTAFVLFSALAVMGSSPFEVWFTQIAPTLDRPSWWVGNQSFSGLILRSLHSEVLPPSWRFALRLAGVASLAALATLTWARRKSFHRDPRLIPAAAGAFTVVGLAFSPIAWEHYHLYLLPLWAWIITTAIDAPRLRPAAGLAILSSWAPLCIVDDGNLLRFEPLQSHMLWGSLVLLAIAVARIASSTSPR